MPTTPSDPLFASQWHFALIGDIRTIWDEYSGAGVHVGVYDDGTDYRHEDIAANYDASRHVVNAALAPIDPFPAVVNPGVTDWSDDNPHGTSTAGLIGAAQNGVGGVGVAWGVGLTGVNIFDPGRYGYVNDDDPSAFLDVAGQAAGRFDITSNSWGATPWFDAWQGLNGGDFSDLLDAVYAANAAAGRRGLGTVTVQAAGNDNLDANGDGTNASRFTITVAATGRDGFAADYSNYGAAILVAAPAAEVTTDITGRDGYDATNYTSTFGGTSAATPVVAGVAALMLQANRGLGWRDVQEILANSATLTGSAFDGGPSTTEDGRWQANHSGRWNGGGHHVHTNYGFGMVNAYNAVRMAEVWSLFGPAGTSANEAHAVALNDFPDVTLPDNNATGFDTSFTVTEAIDLDHVALTLDFRTTYIGDLNITLTSAEGTTITLARGRMGPGTDVDGAWVWGAEGFRGELSAGTWRLHVADIFGGDLATLRAARLDLYGTAASADDTYHFTDEFLAMRGFEPSRATIADRDGGIDWLDLAAVRGAVELNLTNGQTFRVAGTDWARLEGVFENAVTGDGNDAITGNARANVIHSMRGNDRVQGGKGNDSINGGAGEDVLAGGIGNDQIQGGAGRDDIAGGDGRDSIGGGAGNDILSGASGDDLIYGSDGNDQLAGNDGNDRFYGGSGNDTMTGGLGADIFHFGGAFGTDRITDFQTTVAGEAIDLSRVAAITGFADLVANHLSQVAGSAVITAGAHSITLQGVAAASLQADDFLF